MEDQGIPNQDVRLKLFEQAKEAPLQSGVYLLKDEKGVILYVGKAKNLRNRVTSYFIRAPHETPRTEMLLRNVDQLEMILTQTESEALILECTLIKKHRPKYNVRLKDDKAYPYLKLNLNEDFPRIEWTRRVLKDGAHYFGPFPSSFSARQIKDLLNEFYQLRDCSDNTFRHRTRPCILYQMGKCTAPCVGFISKGDYRERLDEVVSVLEGRGHRFEEELRKRMMEASEEENFEAAAYYRDQIFHLQMVTAVQSVDDAGSSINRDVLAIEKKGTLAHAIILQVRSGRVVAVKHVHVQNTDDSQSEAEVLSDFISQFYLSPTSPETDLESEEILMGTRVPEQELLEETLKIKLRIPESDLEKQLLRVAQTNARHSLEQDLKIHPGHSLATLEEVQKKLHLEKLPSRIECYDNSNIQGEDAVSSRVVFIDGAPEKSLYRKYKIKTVVGANDFETMKEVLGRRFLNSTESLPDLIVVDGGKGQLSQAVAILEEFSIQGVEVVGLAKARTESDFKSSEVHSSMERIFIPGRKNPVPLLPHTQAYRLLTHIRDEAHRFAIQYHRKLREKRVLADHKKKRIE